MTLRDLRIDDRAFACPSCHQPLAPAARDLLPRGQQVACTCGHRVTSCFTAEPMVRTTNAHLLDVRTASVTEWFHWTAVENWDIRLAGPNAPLAVHIGTESTAMFMRYGRYRSGSEDGGGWLHRVRLRRPVAADIISDDDANLFTFTSPMRYVNVCEAAGSISVVANPEDIEVLESTYISPVSQECAARPAGPSSPSPCPSTVSARRSETRCLSGTHEAVLDEALTWPS